MGKIVEKKTQFEGKSDIVTELVLAWIAELKKKPDFSKQDFHKIKNKIYWKYKINNPFQSIELIERYNYRFTRFWIDRESQHALRI